MNFLDKLKCFGGACSAFALVSMFIAWLSTELPSQSYIYVPVAALTAILLITCIVSNKGELKHFLVGFLVPLVFASFLGVGVLWVFGRCALGFFDAVSSAVIIAVICGALFLGMIAICFGFVLVIPDFILELLCKHNKGNMSKLCFSYLGTISTMLFCMFVLGTALYAIILMIK